LSKRRKRRQQNKQGSQAFQSVMRAAHGELVAGRLSEAESSLKKASKIAPLEAEPQHMLALIAYRQGRIFEAGVHILEATTRDDQDINIHANCGAIMNMLGRPQEAEAASRYVIERDPNHADAYCNLAVSLEVQGRLEEAEEACLQALKRRPDYPEAKVNLGNLRMRGGDVVGAVECYAAAVLLAPENALAHANLSVALRELGELEVADEQCRMALDLAPESPEVQNALGNLRIAQGRYREAAKAFVEAVRLRPEFREARFNLAGAHFKSGDLGAAEIAYTEVIELEGETADTQHGLGVVALAEGRLDAAIEAFGEAVKLRPEFGEAHYNLAAAGGEGYSDPNELERLVERDDLAIADRIGGLFALGEIQDKRGDTAAAFTAFDEGNRLRRKHLTGQGHVFDGDAFDADISNIKKLFDRAFFEARDGWGDGEASPVFIVGMPRSGTTLFEQIIASHRDVVGCGELNVIGGLVAGYPKAVGDLNQQQTRDMASGVAARFAALADGRVRVIDKTPFNFLYLGLIQMLFPAARIIQCYRDRLDVGVSCYFQNFSDAHPWSTDLSDIGRVISAHDRISTHWREVLSLSMMEIRYEDLLVQQEAVSRKLIKFLGLKWDVACLNFDQTQRPVFTASNWQVRKPLYKTALGRSDKYLQHIDILK